jgi:hypothetical protein
LTVSVPGEVRQQPALLAFGTQKETQRLLNFDLPLGVPLFDGSSRIQFLSQLQNQGNVQFNASGRIRITDPLGSQVQVLELPGQQVFPGESGTFVRNWENPPPIGFFTAELTIDAASSQLVLSERLLVLPWQQVLCALLVAIGFRLLLGSRFSLPLPGRRKRVAALADAASSEAPPAMVEAAQPTPADIATPLPELAPADRVESPAAAEAEPAFAVAKAPTASGAPLNGQTAVRTLPAAPPSKPVTSTANQLDVEDLLRWGQQAARAGDRLVAYRLFVQAVKIDPTSEEAWVWRAATAGQPDEARESLEQVLQINPTNERARRGIDEIERRFASRGS